MEEVIILFLHHQTDDLTKYHYKVLVENNPDILVVPVSYRLKGDPLPFSMEVADKTPEWAFTSAWKSADMILYRWINISNRPKAMRYVIVEYDTLANDNVYCVFQECWNKLVAAPNVFIYGVDKWTWFSSQYKFLPDEYKQFACGLMPMSCLFFNGDILEEVAATPKLLPLMSEFRIGTIVKSLGVNPVCVSDRVKSTVSYLEKLVKKDELPGWFHPIKKIKE